MFRLIKKIFPWSLWIIVIVGGYFSIQNYLNSNVNRKEAQKLVLSNSNIYTASYKSHFYYYSIGVDDHIKFLADNLIIDYCKNKKNYNDCVIDRSFLIVTTFDYAPTPDIKSVSKSYVQIAQDCLDRVNIMSSLLNYFNIDDFYHILFPHHIGLLVHYKDMNRFKKVPGAYIDGKKYIYIETTLKDLTYIGTPFNGKYTPLDVLMIHNPIKHRFVDPSVVYWDY